MSIGVLVLNFGEPDSARLDQATAYLERIFLQNASLEGHADEAAVARARQLAHARAPSLVEAYRAIGGSPLNAQADAQALALERELSGRLPGVRVHSAFQFTDPSILDAAERARDEGVETLVALPVYPLCGYSTTVATIDDVRAALARLSWTPRLLAVGGWHRHPDYLDLRVDCIRSFVLEDDLDLDAADTLLYFSVHGTPVSYLEHGRYDRYVFEHCRDVAARLGVDHYQVGFQNHTNRRIRWTQPDNEDAIRACAERHLVVVPISFMHEQSETLDELDVDVRAFVERLGKKFHRVPVPHDDARFPRLLADLVLRALAGDPEGDDLLSPCRCCGLEDARCTNGERELPPSPYVPADVD